MSKKNKNKNKTVNIDEVFQFKYLNPKILYLTMRMPTVSLNEHIICYYIKKWAEENNVKFESDLLGNITLTKGELSDGEFYPCVTAHLDTVQYNSTYLIEKKKLMPIKIRERKSDGKHILFAEHMGIGADDKAGVAICLSLFDKFDKLKAFFPVGEEIGCFGTDYFLGSKNASFFNDVAYVIGFDSPEFNRSAWASNGVKLFNTEWFNKNLKDVASSNGVFQFRDEPYTDVYMIRSATELICMNFGNGGYDAHTNDEYLVLEECDAACKLGIDVINSLGNVQHKLEVKQITNKDKDDAFFTNYVKANGGYQCNHTRDNISGRMNVNDFMTMKTKLALKLQMLGVDTKEIEECFDWSCGNWHHFLPIDLFKEDFEINLEEKEMVESDKTEETETKTTESKEEEVCVTSKN